MSTKDKTLCERCKERPATCHICYGNTGESQDLCETCFQEFAPQGILAGHKALRDAIQNGKCKYCDQPAAGGAGSSTSDSDEPQFDLKCKECSRDFVEFYKMPENDLPIEGPLYDDPKAMKRRLKQHRELERRLKEFIKQRISKRKPKNG